MATILVRLLSQLKKVIMFMFTTSKQKNGNIIWKFQKVF
jgi:hypothetical protein